MSSWVRVFNSIASLSSIGHKLVYLSLRATLGNQYSNAEPSAHEAAGGDTTTANHEEADEEDDLPPTAPWLRRQQLRQTERKLEAEGVEPKEEANESAEETKAVKKKEKGRRKRERQRNHQRWKSQKSKRSLWSMSVTTPRQSRRWRQLSMTQRMKTRATVTRRRKRSRTGVSEGVGSSS